MKILNIKIYCLFIVILILSCTYIQPVNDWHRLEKIPKNIESRVKIYNWLINNITYELYANTFRVAQVTLDSKKGNCANKALLELALIKNILNKKGELVYCQKKAGLHYTVRIDNEILEDGITAIYEVIAFDDIAEYIYYRQ